MARLSYLLKIYITINSNQINPMFSNNKQMKRIQLKILSKSLIGFNSAWVSIMKLKNKLV